MLRTDIRHDLVQSFYRSVATLDFGDFQDTVNDLKTRAAASLAEEHIAPEDQALTLLADMRYVGQEYVVTVELAGPDEDLPSPQEIVERFHQVYQDRFGYAVREAQAEFVNLRVAAVGKLDRVEIPAVDDAVQVPATPVTTRPVRFRGEWHESSIFDRAQLAPGHTFSGPAIVNELSATTVIPPEFDALVDGYGNIVVEAARG
ncbi:MAG: hypothetical protein R2843_07265 [Thermomicrobiales bacterium]